MMTAQKIPARKPNSGTHRILDVVRNTVGRLETLDIIGIRDIEGVTWPIKRTQFPLESKETNWQN